MKKENESEIGEQDTSEKGFVGREIELAEMVEKVMLLIKHIRERRTFLEGIFLGLFYGIAGNVLVAHYYGILESWITGDSSAMYRIDQLGFVIMISIILLVSLRYYFILKGSEKVAKEVVLEAAKRRLKLSLES